MRAPQPRSHVDPGVTSIIVQLPEPAGLSLRMGASASRPSEASTTTGRLTTAGACAHATRAAASAPSRQGQSDTRHVVRTIADANHGLHASRLSPRSCRTLRAILAQTHELAILDALPGSSRASGRSVTGRSITGSPVTRRWMHCTQWPSRCRARSPGTSTSSFEVTSPRMHPAGSRGGARAPTAQSRADATRAAASPPSRQRQTRHAPRRPHRRRREPRTPHVGPLPSVLPGAPRDPLRRPQRRDTGAAIAIRFTTRM